MSELSVGSLSGLAANSYVIDVASGSSLDLSAGAVLPAGSILQVVQTVKTDTFSSASTSYVDVTGLSATITPSATGSKILIGYQLQGNARSGTVGGFFKLLRDSTDISIADAAGSRDRTSGAILGGQDEIMFTGGFFLDSPSTTSATTYKVQMRANVAQTVYLNRSHGDTDAATTPRGVSSITLMEVAG